MSQLMDRTIHVRFDGRSEELPAGTLNVTAPASDAQIKQALTRHFDLPASHLNGYVVVRNAHAIIVRPEALYG
jgi:hypothetical protein